MTKLNMASESTKPQMVPAHAEPEKHDDTKTPAAPLVAPTVQPAQQK